MYGRKVRCIGDVLRTFRNCTEGCLRFGIKVEDGTNMSQTMMLAKRADVSRMLRIKGLGELCKYLKRIKGLNGGVYWKIEGVERKRRRWKVGLGRWRGRGSPVREFGVYTYQIQKSTEILAPSVLVKCER